MTVSICHIYLNLLAWQSRGSLIADYADYAAGSWLNRMLGKRSRFCSFFFLRLKRGGFFIFCTLAWGGEEKGHFSILAVHFQRLLLWQQTGTCVSISELHFNF